jgi:hypothetical protein
MTDSYLAVLLAICAFGAGWFLRGEYEIRKQEKAKKLASQKTHESRGLRKDAITAVRIRNEVANYFEGLAEFRRIQVSRAELYLETVPTLYLKDGVSDGNILTARFDPSDGKIVVFGSPYALVGIYTFEQESVSRAIRDMEAYISNGWKLVK